MTISTDEKAEIMSDRDWWQMAGDVLGLKLFGFTYRAVGAFRDPADHDATVNLTGKVAERLIALASRSGVGCRRTDSELLGGKEQAEGGSAALRLSVIEECAKVADGVGEAYGMDETGWIDCSETIAMQIRTLKDNTHGA